MTSRDAEALLELKRLRTLITARPHFMEAYTSEFIDELFHNFKYLRALDLSHTNIAGLPDSIGDLKLLRYLSIEGNETDSLPESICSLYNLQILNLTATFDLEELPSGIVNLPNIRHLMLNESGAAIPRGLGKLTNLQTLDCIALGPTGWRYQIEELKGLVNHRGKLIIYNLRYVDKYVAQTETPLETKDRIEFLTLHWYEDAPCEHEDMDDDTTQQVFECFRPHPNLKQLIIYAYGGARFARWLGDSSFSKLVNLEMAICWKCNLLPPLGQLPSLRVLSIYDFPGLRRIGREFCGIGSATRGFPSLETLTFSCISNCEEWDGVEADDFPRLLQLTIDRCPKLRIFPQHPFSSLRKLELSQFGDISDDAPFISSDDDTRVSSHPPLLVPQYLSFRGFHSFSIDMDLPSLMELKMSQCSKLTFVAGLTNLTSLHSLIIDDCPYLRFSPAETLSSTLQHVKIRNSPWLKQWDEANQDTSIFPNTRWIE
ncbi:disease resistance [Musa troglodytarum]|uniref:Disease resistance n=1 Tax=Musa troglodytarum TaxID=320322 RepID=A0A9E7IA78_9LILI|nr:disease resistance [Musa troglodytarum]